MSKVLKALALLLLITTLVWGVTIWQWQRAPRELDNHQIVFHLVLLPAALSVLAWGLYAFAGALMRHARSPDTGPAAPTAVAAPADPAAATAAAERGWTHALWAAAAAAGPARSLDELADALQAGSLRPALDPELIDSRGLPVFAARAPDLDTDAVRAELEELAPALAAGGLDATTVAGSALGPEHAWTEPSERQVRALALLAQPLQEALAAFAVLAEPLRPARRPGMLSPAAQAAPRFVVAEEGPSRRTATASAAGLPGAQGGVGAGIAPADPLARSTPYTQLRADICLLVPADWTSAERQIARLWLARRLAAALPEVALEPAVAVLPCAQAEQALQQLDQRLVDARRDARPALLLALAAESQIGADWVDRLEAHGLLFSGERPEGRVPGEAAVALLLSSPDWPAPAEGLLPGGHATPLRLHRPVIARRSQPASDARVSATALRQAAAQALQAAGLTRPAEPDALRTPGEPDDERAPLLALACCDLDTRPSRSSEAAQALLDALPGLDPVHDVQALGQALGDVGLPRALLALALASRLVRDRDEPALVFTVHDPLERAALVVAPPGPLAPPGPPSVAPARQAATA
jgi:hypothetical protein